MGETTFKKPFNWQPLFRFFLLGMVVFGLRAWFEKSPDKRADIRQIEVSSTEVEWLRTLWVKRMGREPTAGEFRSQVDQLVREKILSLEAERLGLGANDQVVQRRLAQKMDYLFRDLAAGVQPAETELQAYLADNRERYEIPGQISFEQVLYKTDRRSEADAEKAVALFLDKPDRESDVTMLPRENENLSSAQVQGLFGKAFAEAIQTLNTGGWEGPVRSGFGLHAVMIHERSPGRLPSVDDIRERLTEDWRFEQQQQAAGKAYAVLRGEYLVLVEGMPYSTDVQ